MEDLHSTACPWRDPTKHPFSRRDPRRSISYSLSAHCCCWFEAASLFRHSAELPSHPIKQRRPSRARPKEKKRRNYSSNWGRPCYACGSQPVRDRPAIVDDRPSDFSVGRMNKFFFLPSVRHRGRNAGSDQKKGERGRARANQIGGKKIKNNNRGRKRSVEHPLWPSAIG